MKLVTPSPTQEGSKVTIAVPTFEMSAELAKLTLTVVFSATQTGALYSPLEETLPASGVTNQEPAVLLVLVTVPKNCCVSPA